MFRATDVNGLRDAWRLVETTSNATLDRARAIPVAKLYESVDEEWSYVDTLRHLVYATDRWIVGPVLGEKQPFHRLGMPNDNLEPWRGSAIDVDANPTFEEVVAVRLDHMATVTALLDRADNQELQRAVASPNGGTTSVGDCIRIVMNEEFWHDQFANRDLDVLTSA
jgi:hypothetical protein